jgi:hypothetical protein
MAEDAEGPGGPGESGESVEEPRDPWAPPGTGVSLGKDGRGGHEDSGPAVAGQPAETAAGGQSAPPPIPPAPGAAGSARQTPAPQPPDAAPPPGPAPVSPPPGAGHGSGRAGGGQGYGQPGAAGQGYVPGYYYGRQYGPSGPGRGGPGVGGPGPGGPGPGGPGPGGPGFGGPGPGEGPPFDYPPGHSPYAYAWPGALPLPNGKAVAALVLGIISLVAVCTCWGAFLAILTSPIALGLGLSARRSADLGRTGGRSQAVAGFVMGIIGTVLAAVLVVGLVLLLTLFRDDVRDPSPGGGDGSSINARGAVTPMGAGAVGR